MLAVLSCWMMGDGKQHCFFGFPSSDLREDLGQMFFCLGEAVLGEEPEERKLGAGTAV